MGSGSDGGSLTGLVFWLKGLEVVWPYLYTIELHSSLYLALLSPKALSNWIHSVLHMTPHSTSLETPWFFGRLSEVIS
jgi:hypothetical protein